MKLYQPPYAWPNQKFRSHARQKMRQYSPRWTDDQVIEWDGNFRDDDALFLICSERDVEIAEYRKVLEECIEYRHRGADGLAVCPVKTEIKNPSPHH